MADTPHQPAPPSLAVIDQDLLCQECGYNLRGLTGTRCPECGTTIGAVRATEPQIPWSRRREIGRIRAYWKTVALVCRHEKRFCEEIARPVSYRDSQSFRWVTVALAYLPILCVSLIVWYMPPDSSVIRDADDAIEAGWPVVLVDLGILMFLAAATGMPAYFFHPNSAPIPRQNRAIALSYYATAPLAFGFPALAAAAAPAAFAARDGYAPGAVLLLVMYFGIFTVAQVFGWWILLMTFARRPLSAGAWRGMAIGLGVPFLWLVLAAIVFVLPLPLVYYGYLFVKSMMYP